MDEKSYRMVEDGALVLDSITENIYVRFLIQHLLVSCWQVNSQVAQSRTGTQAYLSWENMVCTAGSFHGKVFQVLT